MKKTYLEHGSRVYSTGCWLWYDAEKNCFRFDGIDDDTFHDGELVNFNSKEKPFIEKEIKTAIL